MRIMATSDLHGNLEGLDPNGADVVVLAGDIAARRLRGPWRDSDVYPYDLADHEGADGHEKNDAGDAEHPVEGAQERKR